MLQTASTNIKECTPLTPPKALWEELPISEKASETIIAGRTKIQEILEGRDRRIFVIMGPCSIHSASEAMDYARKLSRIARKVDDTMLLVMRVYVEKPRTTIGWKGLVNDPDMDESFNIEKGLRVSRKLMIDLSEMGIYIGTETLNPITPKYLAGLVSWAAVGARTTESQTHRELASGLSMPVGFKNSTRGDVDIAIHAVQSASNPHHFLGIDEDGKVGVYRTKGNQHCHLILRGGRTPNYDATSIATISEQVQRAGMEPKLVIDCSHGNTNKNHALQAAVLNSIVQQIADGNRDIKGIMLESNLEEGNQAIPGDKAELRPGVSVTDTCISWETTEKLLLEAHEKLRPHMI